MKLIKIKYKATFEGTIEVRADNREEAKKIVEQGFGGLTVSVGHSSWVSDSKEEEGIKDWDISTHPEKVTIR
jgi:NMD protein affecting ribosome stability and mRNA decay